MQTKEIEKMSRPELIWELAKHAHQDWFHQLIHWKTEYLRSLLGWYKSTERKGDFRIPSAVRRIGFVAYALKD